MLLLTTDQHQRRAGEYGIRAGMYLRTITRAMEIAHQQGAPCLSARDLRHLSEQAWANAKLAAHHAHLAGIGRGTV